MRALKMPSAAKGQRSAVLNTQVYMRNIKV